jgi:hypothetical protein
MAGPLDGSRAIAVAGSVLTPPAGPSSSLGMLTSSGDLTEIAALDESGSIL